ncbi:SusC/RagA family TonB-linked outer membrane protein [Maribellus luteus]|uniref:SusC/RagA family TonB-linked outer membrane protein n=1 Tax=Maribellus luteus TaxID=2305463 RepID=A0A399T9J8_9BACT|nr:TonB-dependent receptor [Maribellus luteus]RIJ50841.1 SusC/RagA family TonB-linked outer membrane protein [Maribellus luteus]
MKKIRLQGERYVCPSLRKIMLMTKLTTLFILISIMQISANSYSQTGKLDLKLKNTTIFDVFEQIENVSSYRFFYDNAQEDLLKKVSIRTENKELSDILHELLDDTNLTWEVKDNLILVRSKNSKGDSKNILQQQKSISGTVKDKIGEPLPGVTVLVKGTIQGTVTNSEGNYQLTNVPENAVLQFSFVGMLTQEVAVESQTTIDITLQTDAIGIDEVVAIGYGTTTKRKMSSSISTITTEAIADAPYTSVVSGLAGRTPGLFIRDNGGEPGSLPTISLRGGGEPIYVIDGIRASKDEFSMLPPGDIESISMLKDAAAAAVYGFNSANGVVLISTRRGSSEKITLTYSGDFSMQQPTLIPEYMTAYENAILKNEAAYNDGLPQVISDDILDIMKNNLDPERYPNQNPFGVVAKDFSGQRRHNIGLNGTINQTNIYMSLDYFGQDNIYKANNHGLNRYSFRSNISQNFKEIGLKVNGNVSLQRSVRTEPPMGTGEIWSHVRNVGGFYNFYNPDGNYNSGQNPLAESAEGAGYVHDENNRVNGRLEFVWNVPGVEGLSFKALGNYQLVNSFYKNWNANQQYRAQTYLWDNTPEDLGKASLSQSSARTYMYDVEAHATYIRTFADKHTVELTGVYTQRESRYDGFSASRRDFLSSAVDQLFAGSAVGKDNNGNASESASVGYIGRMKYDFDSKYILEGNFRYDGSDNFPDGKRYGFFPSVSAAWNIDREEFIQPVLEKLYLSSLKLRASWGILGSTAGVGRFAYISAYDLVTDRYFVDGTWEAAFREGNLVSNDLSWYERESKNLGVDFGFLEGKVSGSFDWFYYRTTGYLGSPKDTYITPLGKSLPQINTNSAHRRGGFELNMQYHTQIGEVKIDVGGNISYYDQLWEKMYTEDSTALLNPYTRQTHEKDYYTSAYTSLGYYQSIDDIINSPHRLGSTETKPGDLKYQDFNGDGRIDGDDFTRIGKSDFPHILYGINLGARYKGFALEALFQGTSNRQIYLGYMWQSEINHKLYTIQQDSWTAENPNSLFPRTSMNTGVNGSNNTVTSSYWLKDAWYIRMKSLALSYDLKSTLLKNVDGVGSFKLLLSATNLFTISPLNKYYIDPETASSDNYGYPIQKTYNIGVRVSF